MSEPAIHIFNHNAMATNFQVRIAGEEKNYAGQAAQTAFALTDQLEAKLSRFRTHSEISQIGHLAVGEKLRLTEPVFACLKLAQKMEFRCELGTRFVAVKLHAIADAVCRVKAVDRVRFQLLALEDAVEHLLAVLEQAARLLTNDFVVENLRVAAAQFEGVEER